MRQYAATKRRSLDGDIWLNLEAFRSFDTMWCRLRHRLQTVDPVAPPNLCILAPESTTLGTDEMSGRINQELFEAGYEIAKKVLNGEISKSVAQADLM